jgi:putative redox protein
MADKITTSWKGDLIFETLNPNNSTLSLGSGENKEDNISGPKVLMLSSLAGCSGLDVISILDKMKITLNDFTMNTSAELTEDHPRYYKKVDLEYHFYGANLDEEKINRAVELSVTKYCGVMEMFRRFAEVNTSTHFHKQN